ncbi:nucleotidyltransferase domain-containing protein [Oceanobacillus salinisoli]|uniref:nucleotidyltransferase domain-containing protein n=1 Tax=Oceanobacillus salinisoli TaxID=2678611 RepID=UPI0012E15FCD|nr:nucleotidyltransferase domain-containing protein [Oceanobacillus salinisoli]
MEEIIISKLKELETGHRVKILYACEAGSRSWGLHTNESDFDVRFIYIHPPNYYLSIDPVGIGKKKDVINVPIDKSLDIHGWELTKALRLFRKSNPALLEWMHAGIVYHEAFSTMKEMKKMEPGIFSAKTCIHHYVNMAKNNFSKISQQEEINIKMYIHAVRPILLAKWMIKHQTFPPIHFLTLTEDLVHESEEIRLLTEIKTNKQHIESLNDKKLNSFINKEIRQLEELVKDVPMKKSYHITERLNHLFQHTLIEVWET